MRTRWRRLTLLEKSRKINAMIITVQSGAPHRRTAPQRPLPGPATYILHERAREYYGEGTGTLSIKSFFHGQAFYEIGRGRYRLDDQSYLIVNQGQPYAITIDSSTEVESFCIFFEAGFADEVRRSLVTPVDRLLLNPDGHASTPVTFFERSYPHDQTLSPALFHLRAQLAHRPVEQAWLHEQLHIVMQRLLQVHRRVYEEMEQLPAARAATREELYRRLHLAKDYVDDSFDGAISLTELASVAGLSPNHLLRMFKQLFHQTPYQYITARRMEQAQRLLRHTDRSVTDICFSVGFESPGSFSWLFRRHTGVTPTTYRRQTR